MDDVLRLLTENDFITGESLCAQLGVTRAAVWKRMEKLRQEGYAILAAGKRGYCLQPRPDGLLPGEIAKGLLTHWAGRGNILYHRRVSSTNSLLKEHANQGAPRGSLAVCELQTSGKGRLQRDWLAPEGENLLHSLLLCPSLPLEQAQLCTLAAAIAVCQAIEDVAPTLRAGIKWPNDVVIDGRKCVGILSELSADMDGIRFVVMGVGINVNQQTFTGELAEKATSLLLQLQKAAPGAKTVDRRKLLCAYLLRMEEAIALLEEKGLSGILTAYKQLSVTLGARVNVLGMKENFTGLAKAVDATGALLVEDEHGVLRRVLSGDVSVRGVMGYV